jgi:peptidoglycan/xylan/chitin deacetylase (PgdA/CDA1 family)
MYLVKTPFFLKWLYPSLTWHKSRDSKIIYLTFDDGPVPVVTPFVLKTLAKYRARATFFCIGDNIKKYPHIFSEIGVAGHRTGNHTFNHLRGWSTPDDLYIENVKKCAGLVHSDLFRPPYGRSRRSQLRELQKDYSIIMWDVLSGDFDTSVSPATCLDNVLKHTENGSIIVFHDSGKAFERLEYTLPKALEHWVEQGYTFGTL